MGTTYLAIYYALVAIRPSLMMEARLLIAGTILYAWGRFGAREKIQPQYWPSVIVIGTLFFLVGHGGLAWGQQGVSSGLGALLVASEAPWRALVEGPTIRDSKVGLVGISGLLV